MQFRTKMLTGAAVAAAALLLSACYGLGPGRLHDGGPNTAGGADGHIGPSGQDAAGGIGWGRHAFNSNGERIFYTATSERNGALKFTGGPAAGGWMMMHGRTACVTCHGVDGKGGRRGMGPMATMEAKDIRWSTLTKEFSEPQFAVLLREGREPDGKMLSTDMPRWQIADDDITDLVTFLKTLK